MPRDLRYNVSETGRYEETSSLTLWDIPTGREVKKINNMNPSSVAGIHTLFSPNDAFLLLAGEPVTEAGGKTSDNGARGWGPFNGDGSLGLWSIETGKLEKTFVHPQLKTKGSYLQNGFISPDGKYVLANSPSNPLALFDMETGQYLFTFERNPSVNYSAMNRITFGFSPGGQFVFDVSSFSGEITVYNPKNGKIINGYTLPSGLINHVAISPDNRLLVASARGASLCFWDLATGKERSRSILYGARSWVSITPDFYYSGKPDAMRRIHFVDGLNILPFENFDLIYNRPDILLKRMDSSDERLVRLYEAAYHKRLKKMGFTADQISTDMHLPTVQIRRDNLLNTTRQADNQFFNYCARQQIPAGPDQRVYQWRASIWPRRD